MTRFYVNLQILMHQLRFHQYFKTYFSEAVAKIKANICKFFHAILNFQNNGRMQFLDDKLDFTQCAKNR